MCSCVCGVVDVHCEGFLFVSFDVWREAQFWVWGESEWRHLGSPSHWPHGLSPAAGFSYCTCFVFRLKSPSHPWNQGSLSLCVSQSSHHCSSVLPCLLRRKPLPGPAVFNYDFVYFPRRFPAFPPRNLPSASRMPFLCDVHLKIWKPPFPWGPYRTLAVVLTTALPLGACCHLVKADQSLVAFWNRGQSLPNPTSFNLVFPVMNEEFRKLHNSGSWSFERGLHFVYFIHN